MSLIQACSGHEGSGDVWLNQCNLCKAAPALLALVEKYHQRTIEGMALKMEEGYVYAPNSFVMEVFAEAEKLISEVRGHHD